MGKNMVEKRESESGSKRILRWMAALTVLGLSPVPFLVSPHTNVGGFLINVCQSSKTDFRWIVTASASLVFASVCFLVLPLMDRFMQRHPRIGFGLFWFSVLAFVPLSFFTAAFLLGAWETWEFV